MYRFHPQTVEIKKMVDSGAVGAGMARMRADQAWGWIHKHGVTDFAAMTNIAKEARAALAETRTRLSQATVRAPVSGQVISRSVTRGQIISAGTELFRIVRDGRLELDAQVPETELALV